MKGIVYSSEQTAYSQLRQYTKVSELLFLTKSFSCYCKKNLPVRTTKTSISKCLKDFSNEIQARYMHTVEISGGLITDTGVLDELMCNQLVEFQKMALHEFESIVDTVLKTEAQRPTVNKVLHKLHRVVDETVNIYIHELDKYRGCIF